MNNLAIYAIGWVISLFIISYGMSKVLKERKEYPFELAVVVTIFLTFAYPGVLLLCIAAGLIRLFGYNESKPEDKESDEEN